jgi:hypothetical protein
MPSDLRVVAGCTLLAMFMSFGCVHRRISVLSHRDYDDCLAEARSRPVAEGWWCVSDGQIAGAAVSGHLVYQAGDGSLAPITDAELWRGRGEHQADASILERVAAVFDSDGWFRFPQLVHYSRSLQKKNGKVVAGETRDQFVFVLRAPGCLDVVLPFRTDDPAHFIVMNCPDRQLQVSHDAP